MGPLYRAVYQVALGLALLLAAPFLLVRRGGHYLPTIRHRLGWGREGAPRPSLPRRLWLHAVSVGEAGVAATLARALPPGLPLLVTTVTPTGQERARAGIAASTAEVAYLPFDVGFAVRRFFRRHRPSALVLIEGDYWPLVLFEAKRRGLPVVVVNGRVSDKSYRRMRLLAPLLGPILDPVDRFGVQTPDDRERLLALGVPAAKVAVTGNLKYDSPEPPRRRNLEEEIARLAAGRPVLLAGSTMEGEDEQVLRAFELLGGGERALLVLAPRHPERWSQVARLLEERGLPAVRRSLFPAVGRPAVVLLDSMGELAGLYALAAAAFVGGTLVPTGGHNPLEPARYGVPVAVGPHMENFREMADEFDREGAWRRVAGAGELADLWVRWLDDPAAARAQGERALALVAKNRGALDRTLDLLRPVLEPHPPSGHRSGDGIPAADRGKVRRPNHWG